MYILNEMIQIFKSSDEKNINEAMIRGLYNDMYKLFKKIDNEINSLPNNKKNIIRKKYKEILLAEVNGGIIHDNNKN